ncbi:MAG: hypothetical protein LBL26_06545 [Peptococcaceae bacterium]|jgi:hypothetical protein|nr:hypothetical protein [Peptococcaceae bacterium]
MSYPEKFIRGVANPGFVDTDGRASAEIFQFDDAGRDDGFFESSINWYDDESALKLIMEQRKEKDEQTYQFRYGAAIIKRCDADRIIGNPLYTNVFRYERALIEGNQYHGNLLRKDGVLEKRIRNIIASSLALNAQLIPRSAG